MAEQFPAVVSLRTTLGQGCTATKISARQFLTAAHCVNDIPAGRLAAPFQPGGRVLMSGRAVPGALSTYRTLRVTQTRLPESFDRALAKLQSCQQGRIAELRTHYSGEDLAQRIRRVHADAHISARFPDAALVWVDKETPTIHTMPVELGPLRMGAEVTLLGYGCKSVGELMPQRHGHAPVHRTWGQSQVIRVDRVNFYTFAKELGPGTPSLCPGDSGRPVLRDGRVLGVRGPVYDLGPRDAAQSNMSVNLNGLADWDAWPKGTSGLP